MDGFQIKLNEQALRTLLTGPAGPVMQQINTVLRQTANAARANAPADTGQLRASIKEDIQVTGLTIIARVYADAPHAIYQERGTGVYAGRGPITPKRGKYLVFKPKGSKQMVFARKVRGTPATHFLLKAIKATSPWPVTENT